MEGPWTERVDAQGTGEEGRGRVQGGVEESPEMRPYWDNNLWDPVRYWSMRLEIGNYETC